MKKIIFILILINFFIFPGLIFANGSHGSVESILQGIKTNQNVSLNSDIVCSNVTDGQWEELGDAVMSLMHPDENQHELMDQMMGGEGSESLTAAHILMGKQYLGCVSGTPGVGMMGSGGNGMMGGGMMGFGGMMGYGLNYQNMMGFIGSGWTASVVQILIIVSLVLGVIALAKWVFQNKKP